ncbi:unnamed protein product [Acanthosepion pharaonis]|uniref:Uncharacterized protein n=1 Tax=Acanthosepion pharaonis TaxID=158019 RepID=A0A812BHE8_ACAPH|nr:unnamed protein product [Sepia pharaonis]
MFYQISIYFILTPKTDISEELTNDLNVKQIINVITSFVFPFLLFSYCSPFSSPTLSSSFIFLIFSPLHPPSSFSHLLLFLSSLLILPYLFSSSPPLSLLPSHSSLSLFLIFPSFSPPFSFSFISSSPIFLLPSPPPPSLFCHLLSSHPNPSLFSHLPLFLSSLLIHLHLFFLISPSFSPPFSSSSISFSHLFLLPYLSSTLFLIFPHSLLPSQVFFSSSFSLLPSRFPSFPLFLTPISFFSIDFCIVSIELFSTHFLKYSFSMAFHSFLPLPHFTAFLKPTPFSLHPLYP